MTVQKEKKKSYQKCTIQFHETGTMEYHRLKALLENEQQKMERTSGDRGAVL